MNFLEGYLPPRLNERTKEKAELISNAVSKLSALSPKEKEEHCRKVENSIAEVNLHSYKTDVGQAMTLSRYEHKKYRG